MIDEILGPDGWFVNEENKKPPGGASAAALGDEGDCEENAS
jgi:hypothetical protein